MWGLYREDEAVMAAWILPIHNIPIHDIIEHCARCYCECSPRMEAVGTGPLGIMGIMFVHNAIDGRE